MAERRPEPPSAASGRETTTLKRTSGQRAGMATFEKAEGRLLNKMICMRCNARNAAEADRCRKCGYGNLRPKAKEARSA